MAVGIRINNAKNFAGELYATQKYVQDMVSAGVDAGTGITVTTENNVSTIATNLKLIKKSSANSGFAASYQLAYLSDATNGTYTPVTGSSDIDIVKDQFLKSASLVWGTSAALDNGSVAGESNSKTSTAIYPFLKMVMYVNDNGSGSDDTSVDTIYIPVDDLFHDYTAGNGISIAAQVISVLKDASSGKVRIAATPNGVTEGSAEDTGLVDVLTVGANGVKIDNIQAAINYAISVLTSGALQDEIDAASAAEQQNYTNISNVNTALGNVITLAEQSVSLTDAATAGIFTVAITGAKATGDQVVTITTSAGAAAGLHKIVAVYDASGNEIRPDITYNKSTKVATLTADFGGNDLDASWDITYTVAATTASITQPTDR